MESKKYNSFSLGIFPFVSKGYPTKIQTNLEAPELTASVFSVSCHGIDGPWWLTSAD